MAYSRPWMDGATVGRVYRVEFGDLARVGNCWMQGRLKIGDLLLCLEHTGDAFYDYIVLEQDGEMLRGLPWTRLGAYVLGREVPWRPSKKKRELLLAGDVWVKSPLQEF